MIKQCATDLRAPTSAPPVDLDYWYGRGGHFSAYPLDEDYAPPAVFPSDEAEIYYNEGCRDAQWRDMQPEF